MFLKDIITASVAISCLLLMVANRSVKACSCYDALAVKKPSCGADEKNLIARIHGWKKSVVDFHPGIATMSIYYEVAKRVDNTWAAYRDTCRGLDSWIENWACLIAAYFEVWKLTVQSMEERRGRGDMPPYVHYHIRVGEVIKSSLGLTKGKKAFLKTLKNFSCLMRFTTGSQYLLAADYDVRMKSTTQLCMSDETHSISCKHIRVLVVLEKTDAE